MVAVSEVAEWHRSAEGRAVLGMVAVSEVAEWHRSAEGRALLGMRAIAVLELVELSRS